MTIVPLLSNFYRGKTVIVRYRRILFCVDYREGTQSIRDKIPNAMMDVVYHLARLLLAVFTVHATSHLAKLQITRRERCRKAKLFLQRINMIFQFGIFIFKIIVVVLKYTESSLFVVI